MSFFQYRIMRQFYIAILVTLIIQTNSSGQTMRKNTAFCVGENTEYEIAYNWGILWVPAGKVSFTVKSSSYHGKPVYHFDSYGTSYQSYDWFFKVRDRFQSFVDTTNLQNVWATRNTSEGGHEVFEDYIFNHEAKKIYFTTYTGNKQHHMDTLAMAPGVTDMISAIYYTRDIDFSKYKINDKIPLWLLIVGKTYPLYIRYLGKEVLTTRDKHQYNCLKFSAKLVEGTIFKGGEDLIAWVSDDPNHIAVQVEAKILVGSVKALLIKSEHLKSPLTSQIR
jgi:hypothetical protein